MKPVKTYCARILLIVGIGTLAIGCDYVTDDVNSQVLHEQQGTDSDSNTGANTTGATDSSSAIDTTSDSRTGHSEDSESETSVGNSTDSGTETVTESNLDSESETSVESSTESGGAGDGIPVQVASTEGTTVDIYFIKALANGPRCTRQVIATVIAGQNIPGILISENCIAEAGYYLLVTAEGTDTDSSGTTNVDAMHAIVHQDELISGDAAIDDASEAEYQDALYLLNGDYNEEQVASGLEQAAAGASPQTATVVESIAVTGDKLIAGSDFMVASSFYDGTHVLEYEGETLVASESLGWWNPWDFTVIDENRIATCDFGQLGMFTRTENGWELNDVTMREGCFGDMVTPSCYGLNVFENYIYLQGVNETPYGDGSGCVVDGSIGTVYDRTTNDFATSISQVSFEENCTAGTKFFWDGVQYCNIDHANMNCMYAVDMRNPAAPMDVGCTSLPALTALDTEKYSPQSLYVLNENSIILLSMTDPLAPVNEYELAGTGFRGLVIHNGYMYVAVGDAGLKVFRIQDDGSLTDIAQLSFGVEIKDVAFWNEMIWLTGPTGTFSLQPVVREMP